MEKIIGVTQPIMRPPSYGSLSSGRWSVSPKVSGAARFDGEQGGQA